MIEGSGKSGPGEFPLERSQAIARIRSRRRAPPGRRPRAAAAVMSMVDLLSCAFGGALFLFMLTAAPLEPAKASPDARSEQAIVKIDVTTRSARPIFVFTPPPAPTGLSPVIVDPSRLLGVSSMRQVEDARSNLEGGKVWVFGPTPWDMSGDEKRPLYLMFDAPEGMWCLKVGLQDSDSAGRKSDGAAIDAIDVRVRRPDDSAMRSVATISWEPLTLGGSMFSQTCIKIDFGG